MLNQALAGRKEYHDRTCADMVRGRFPAPWHNLNINDMGDNILRKAADELKKAGCRVFAWQDDTYNRGWSKVIIRCCITPSLIHPTSGI